jgi:hypothetical protein
MDVQTDAFAVIVSSNERLIPVSTVVMKTQLPPNTARLDNWYSVDPVHYIFELKNSPAETSMHHFNQ